MQRCVITRKFSHVPVTLLRTECLYGAIWRSILSLYYILLTLYDFIRCYMMCSRAAIRSANDVYGTRFGEFGFI